MSTRRRRERERSSVLPKRTKANADALAAPSRRSSPASVSAQTAFIECLGAICLVEVTLHSLESQEVAFSEQEVLKRALKAIWFVHDWIDSLKLDDLEAKDTARKDEP